MKRLPLIVLPVFALVGLLAASALWRLGDLRQQSATVSTVTEDASQPAEPVEFGGPFSLTDQDGMRRTDMDFRGKYMLIFFGYTHCPDVCPTTLAVEAEALGKIGERASRVVPILVSVDPKRDTPERLKDYLSAFGSNFVGLTGTDEEIEKAADAYEVYYRAHLDGRFGGAEDYSVDHTGNVYLMSPEGKFVAYYSPGIRPDELAADLMMKIPPG
jgi:protein SCO1/2